MSELFTNVSNGKSLVGGAITGVDNSVVIPTDPTFGDLASAIGQISTGKKWAELTLPNVSTGTATYDVSGYNFIPSCIIVTTTADGFSSYYNFAYFKDSGGVWRQSPIRSDNYTISLDNTPDDNSFRLRFRMVNGYTLTYQNNRVWVFE